MGQQVAASEQAVRQQMHQSRWGQMVTDLYVTGWRYAAIAKWIRVHEAQPARWQQDPTIVPNVINGDLLIALHRAVINGQTVWTDMLNEIKQRTKLTDAQIAARCGLARQEIHLLYERPESIPLHSTAQAIRDLRAKV